MRLWEQPPSIFLSSPGLLPFAVLSQTQDRAGILRQVAAQIETLEDRRLQSNVAASSAILAGLLLDKGLVQQILRQEMMQESVIYQEIKAEGWQEGLREGRQEGLREGEVALVLRLLTRRVGTVPDEIREQIHNLSLPQLGSLGEALLDFTALADLEEWLGHQQA